MKKIILLLSVIALVACNTAEKQTAEPEPVVESTAIEATDVADVPTVAENVPAQSSVDIPVEPVIDIDPKYLITSQGVDVFPAGAYSIESEGLVAFVAGKKTPIKVDGYKITTKTETYEHLEYGTMSVDTYVVSENGKDVLSLGSGISIISDKFKTSQNIGVSSTIEEFVTAYPDFELKCTPYAYREDYYCEIRTDQLSNVIFSLDENDVISKEKLTFEYYYANNGKLEPSDFKKDAKIKIFIFS